MKHPMVSIILPTYNRYNPWDFHPYWHIAKGLVSRR